MCGGLEWSGRTYCPAGITCYAKDQWYSQCLRSCPGGWACATNTNTQASTVAPVVSSNNAGSNSLTNYNNKFPYCQFRFGAEFKGGDKDYSHLDYISIWIGKLICKLHFILLID